MRVNQYKGSFSRAVVAKMSLLVLRPVDDLPSPATLEKKKYFDRHTRCSVRTEMIYNFSMSSV